MDINRAKRRERLRVARERGRHTEAEWQQMKDFFEGVCARCLGERGLINVERDHIIPLYHDDSSDGIDNIQPICAFCNISKGPERIDHRPKLAEFLGKDLPDEYKLK
jgi:5-methylcytosine-specific restriction endonuclease McrA